MKYVSEGNGVEVDRDNFRDETQFMDFFDTHVDVLFCYCCSRLNDRERALRLTEQAFREMWSGVIAGRLPTSERLYAALECLITRTLKGSVEASANMVASS